MKTIYEWFHKFYNHIVIIVESIFVLSMLVYIALGHIYDGYVGTHAYKLSASFFMGFGILFYRMKQPTVKSLLKDTLVKSIPIIVAAIIIFKLTNVADFSGMLAIIYPVILLG